MASLRIAFIPNLMQAVQSEPTASEAILERGIQQIEEQKITGISVSSRLRMQGVVWVEGPPEALARLKRYLHTSGLSYEEFNGTPGNAAVDPAP